MKKDKTEAKGGFIQETKTPVKQKEVKKDKKKDKKPGFFAKIGMKVKEVFSELKKVDWPSFGKIVKQTGVVIAVVVIFLVLIFLFDAALLKLLELVM